MVRVSLVGLMVFTLTACTQELPVSDAPLEQPTQFRSQRQDLDPGCAAIPVVTERELLIRDLGVVEDPIRTRWTGSTTDGAWTFGRLMTAMAGPTQDASVFVRTWLSQWETAQSINGLTVTPRAAIRPLVVDPWLAASGGARLDLTRAPFRLLAIVYRPDLASPGSAGEGRFVFGVLDGAGNALQFTVILEYRLPASTPADAARWATDFHALGALVPGTAAYNSALEAITTRFTAANVEPTRPNGSAISQVRSNEIALSAPWELREFRLAASGALAQTTVALTPDFTLAQTSTLASFINTNAATLRTGTFSLPLAFNGVPFTAGSALTPGGFTWQAPGVTDNEARFMLSVNTCNGCHAGETNTAFLHVAPRTAGSVSALSGFLTGLSKPDPVIGSTTRSFNDLARRADELRAQVCGSSGGLLFQSPTEGAEVSGVVSINATFASPIGSTIRFSVDGIVQQVLPAVTPLTLSWDTASVAFGRHTLTLESFESGAVTPRASTSRSVDVRPRSAPDFTVTAFSMADAVLPSGSVTVSYTVCNVGNQFGSANVIWGASMDSTLDLAAPASPDQRLGFDSVSLNAGSCTTLTGTTFLSLPNQTPGIPSTWFFGAEADAPSSVQELSERNNQSTVKRVIVGDGPDFVVTAVKGPPVAALNAVFAVEVTACNRGTRSGFATIDVLRSDDTVISNADSFIASDSWSLEAGRCQTHTVFGAPFGALTGVSFLGARVLSAPNELDRTNDTLIGSTLALGTGADFTVMGITAPPSALPSSRVTVSVKVCNQGNQNGTTTVDVLSSSDTVLTLSGDAVVATASVFIQAGQCVTQSFLTSPLTLPQGFLGALVESNDLNPANNAGAAQRLLLGSQPDFTLTSFKPTLTSALAGATTTATYTACNQGTLAATATVTMMASVDSIISPATGLPGGDLVLATQSFTLAAGACSSRSFSAPAPTLEGAWFLGAVVDPGNTVAEFLETNNATAGVPFFIGASPDFVISAITGPGSALPGTLLTVQVTLCNRGPVSGTMNAWVGGSTDTTITTQDRFIGTVNVTLAARQCLVRTVQGPMPGGISDPDSFFLGAIADFQGSVLELDESNNTLAGATIGSGNAQDPAVTAVELDGGVDAGIPQLAFNTPFSAPVTICNFGTQVTSPRAELVVSFDDVIAPPPANVTPFQGQDLRIGSGGVVVTLQPNSCTTQWLTGTLPTVAAPGTTFVLGAVVDWANSITPEFSEFNNARAGPLVQFR